VSNVQQRSTARPAHRLTLLGPLRFRDPAAHLAAAGAADAAPATAGD